jgi:TldD protein
LDKSIVQVRVRYFDLQRTIGIANSDGVLVSDQATHTMFVVQAIAAKDGELQVGYEPLGGTVGFELFETENPEQSALNAAGKAVLMLHARKAPGGKMPVVISSSAGGTMIHEAIGHGLEADLAGQGLSVYQNKLGEQIASSLVSVADDKTLPGKRGSYRVDDEGTPAERTLLVENGLLKSFMYNRLEALRAGKSSTANGRRESFRFRPIVRMSNTMILPGKSAPGDIIKSVKAGLFVKKMGGGQVDTVSGDFVFEVSEGYLIEGGEVGEPVRGATLVGNGPRVLMEIDMVGSDLGFGIGTCGKDNQAVPVADGQPTLRIPEMIVGGVVD